MFEKGKAQIGGKFEAGFEVSKKPQTSKEVRAELQGQGIRTLTDYNELLHSEKRKDFEAFIGAAMFIFGLIVSHEVSGDENEEEKKDDVSSRSFAPAKTKKRKEVDSEKEAEITQKLEEKRKAEKKPVEIGFVPLISREKYQPGNIFYIGDSYMGGITRGRVDRNKYAQGSRPFVAFGKNHEKTWGGNDVESVVYKVLDNPNCKLMILAGGVNDFYSYGNPKKSYERGKKAFERIIARAKNRPDSEGGPVKLVIYKVPKIPKIPRKKSGEMDYYRKKKINKYTDMLNDFLSDEWVLSESSMDIIDTNKVVGDSWGDSIHPNKKGYENLFEQVQSYIT